MSVVNITNLLVQLNQKINLTSDDKEILILTKAIEKLRTGIVFTVPTFETLPDASENVGRLYLVENDGIIYFSVSNNPEYWVPIAQISLNTIWSWGSGTAGILGNGTTVSRCSPGTIWGDFTTWCEVFSGYAHTTAIKCDGTLWTWGCNSVGQLGDGTTVSRCSPGTIFGGGTNWCRGSLSGGAGQNVALKTDGTLWTWGTNLCGLLGDGTTVSRSSPGTVFGGGTNWCWVSGGTTMTAAIKTDGTLWTWGSNCCGQLGSGTTVSRSSPGTVSAGGTTWCRVFAGAVFAAGIKTDGTLWTWGCNYCGQLGDGTTVSRSSPGTTSGCGTNWCLVDGPRAIKTDGTLWTWGVNTNGGNGDGTTVSRSSPGTTWGSYTTWCSLGSGPRAIKTDGTIWTWGSNAQGRLGDGTTANRSSPGTIAGDGTNWFKITAGGLGHVVALSKQTL